MGDKQSDDQRATRPGTLSASLVGHLPLFLCFTALARLDL